VMRLCL